MGFDIDKLGKAAEENKKKKATKPVGKEVATAYYGRNAIEKLKKEPEKATVKDFNTAVKGARVLGKYGLLSDEDANTVATGADTVFSNAAKSSPARVMKRDFDKKTDEKGGLLPDVFGMREQTQASFPAAAKKAEAPEGSWWKDKPTTAFDIQSRYHNLGKQFSGLQEKFIAGEATDEDFDDYTRSMNTLVSEAPKIFDAEITKHEVKSYRATFSPFTSTQEADEAKAAVGKAYESVYERFLKGQATEEDYTALAGSMADYEGRNKKAILDGIYVSEADDALRAAKADFEVAADSLESVLTDAAYDPDDPAAAAALKVKEEAESRVHAAEKQKYDAEAIRGEYRDSAAYDKLLGQYAYAFEAPDFAEKSKYKTTANGKKAKLSVSGTYEETGFNDYYYDYINKNPDAQSIKTTNDLARLGASAAFVKTDETEMNEDEVALYNYLYATEGPEKAGDFVKDLTGVLNKRSRQTYQNWYADYAAKHPVRASVFSTLIAPAKGVIGTVGQISDYADDGKLDQNAPYNKLSHVQSSIRSAVTKEIEENWGAVGSFAYGTGMSMADFLFTALIGKGVGSAVSGSAEQAAKAASSISLGIMGSGAAADATIDAKDRGLDDNQAMLLGVIAGAAEIITEKVSLENLFSDEWEKSAWKYLTKNLVAEGSEEGASSLINLAADVLIAGDKSEIKQAVYKYMDLGYSEQEAFGRAMADQAEAIGLDMLGGAVSGGLMGGGRIGLGAITQVRKTNIYYKELGGKLRTGGDGKMDALFELAGENAENSDSYKLAEKLRKALAGGKAVSDTDLGKLEVLTLADIEKASVKAQSTKGEAVSEAAVANVEAGMNNDAADAKNKSGGLNNDTGGIDNGTVTFDNKAAGVAQVPSANETAVADGKAATQETENPFGTEDEGLRSEDGRSENVFGEEEEADFDDANPFAYAEESEEERNDRRLEKDYGIPDEKERESRLFFEAGLSEGDIDEDSAASIKRISKLVDKDIYFYREAAVDGTVSNGYYDSSDGSIHINLQAANPVAQIIGHELTHSLESSKSYAALQKTVFDYITKTAGASAIDDERARLADVYKRNGKAHSTEAEVDADILANFVGTKLLTDENAIRYVVGYKRSFGVWMHEQITRLKAALGSKNAKTQVFLDKAARLYHAALAESKNAVRSENGGKKNSIVYLDNGMMYVQASRNVISGTDINAWRKQISDFYDWLLQGKQSIDIKSVEGDVFTLTKKETEHKARDRHKMVNDKSQPMTNTEFAIKLRAESHIDELVETSNGNKKGKVPDTKNHPFAKDGFTYRKTYFEDFNGDYYEITLSIGHNGTTATVYNVGKIKKGTVPTAAISAVVGSKTTEQYLYAHSISEIGENVNSSSKKSFSVSEADEFDESIMDTDVNAETLRELKQEVERKASSEYDKLLQEEYNKRQVLYNPDEGKSVKREDLKKVDKEYLERTERGLVNRLAEHLGVPFGKKESLRGIVSEMADEFLEKGNISQTSVDEAFEQALESGKIIDSEYYDAYKYVKDFFRTTSISVSEKVRKDFTDWNLFRKSTMGTLRLVNMNGDAAARYTVEDAYKEIQELAPGLVRGGILNDADQLREIFRAVSGIKKIEHRVSDAYSDEQKAWEKRDFENAVYDSIRDFRTVRVRAIETVRADTGFDPEMFANMSEDDKNNIAASLIKTNNAAVEAKRNIDKVSRKFPLTGDEEILIGELLKGKITFAGIDGNRYNLKNIKAVYEARSAYEANAAVLSEYAKKHKAMLIAEADGVLRNMVDTHDKAGINYSTETAERNIRDTFGDNATSEKIIDTYFRPVHKNEAAKTRMMNEYIARVKELKLSNKLSAADKKAGRVSESAAVQILGEAKGNIEFLENQKKRGKALAERDGKTLDEWKGVIADLWTDNPQLDKPKIEAAVTEFRKIYNELIGEINRVRVLNGYPAISYRAGYFPHFSRAESIDGIMDKITAALGGSTEVTELPTEIAGRTGVFKPGIRWFGAALERQGISTDYDALYGFARYLDGAADIIYHTDDIQRLRALASQVRYRTTNESIQAQVDDVRRDRTLDDDAKEEKIKKLYDKGGYALSGFVNWLEEYTNILAGKKSELDRKIESAIGRKFYNLSKAIEGRVGANMVGGNLASALTNFIPITQAGGSVGSLDLLSGMWDTIKSYKADDGFADRSDFLTSRFGVDALAQTPMQKISSAAGVPMEFIDAFTSNTLVRARYNQNLRSGLSEEAALREADEWAAGLMAGRSKGEMPTIYHSRNLLLKPFTMFQLEVKNQYSYLFKDLPRDFKNRDKNLAKLIAAYFKIFLGAYIFNDLYEKLVGRRSALDPLGIINDTVGDVTGYKLPNVIDGIGNLVSGNGFDFEKVERPDNNADLIGGIAMDIGGEVPFIGGALGGGRIPLLGGGYDKTPVKSIVPDIEKITNAIFNEKWSTKKRVNTAVSELGKSVGANVIAPVAGGQIRKILQGVSAAVSGGSYTLDADGNKILQYPVISENKVELIGNIAKGALFGKSSFETAGDWADSGFKSFSAKATALYDGLCDSGESEKAAFALISNLRNAEKTDEESRSAVQRDMIRHSALTGSGKAIAYAALGASDKEQELIASLDDAGADMGAVADALMDIKDIDGSKALKGAEKSNAKRSVLLQMGLTDEEKQSIYRVVFNESRESEIAEFGAAGMSFDTFLKIQNEYSEIGERDLKASEKATEFSYIIDGMKLNDKQREVAKDCFTYFSMVPAEASRYDKFVAAGLDKDLSYTLNGAMAALEPEEGKQSVSAIQKYRVIIDSDLTEDERETAFRVVMSEDEYAKFERGRSLGMPQEAYVLYKENTGDFDTNGNGRLSGSEIEDLIEYISGGGKAVLPGSKSVRFISMTTAQKAVLWQMMSGSKSVKNNPYNSKKGVQAAKEYLRLKELENIKE